MALHMGWGLLQWPSPQSGSCHHSILHFSRHCSCLSFPRVSLILYTVSLLLCADKQKALSYQSLCTADCSLLPLASPAAQKPALPRTSVTPCCLSPLLSFHLLLLNHLILPEIITEDKVKATSPFKSDCQVYCHFNLSTWQVLGASLGFFPSIKRSRWNKSGTLGDTMWDIAPEHPYVLVSSKSRWNPISRVNLKYLLSC